MRVSEFKGTVTQSPAAGIKPDESQVDEGSDRFHRGSWRRRRGIRRALNEKLDAPITALLGWDLPGVEYAYVVVSGGEVHGYSTLLPDPIL